MSVGTADADDRVENLIRAVLCRPDNLSRLNGRRNHRPVHDAGRLLHLGNDGAASHGVTGVDGNVHVPVLFRVKSGNSQTPLYKSAGFLRDNR